MNIDHIPKELIAKIQKLMKLEEGAKKLGNIEEAANAAGKIRDILMKHNLDLYTVQNAGDQTQKEAPIIKDDYQPEDFTKPHEGDWVKRLVKTIAPFYLCKCFGYTNTAMGLKVTIIGTATNVEIVWYTVEQLVNRIRPLSRDAFKAYTGHEKRNTFFRGFFRGAVEGIQYQLAENAQREVYKAKEAEERKRAGKPIAELESTAIMFIGMQVQEQRRVQQFIDHNINFGNSTRKGSSLSGVGGKQTGFETGKKINIASGVGSGASTPKSKWLN